MERQYVCIDLKSFYASVECVERGLDPFTTNLVVADPERTEKTICLAITPAMKALGVHNRCRVFEIPKNIEYIMAPPRMQLYLDYSANIYSIYLKYISKDDIHVYSVDEVFMDVTEYLALYGMTAKELGIRIMEDIFETTGITATCGIGTNLYLAKIALDIMAKRVEDHIGILDEESYRKHLGNHRPLTDFWRVGPGTVRKLETLGLYTMNDIAEADEDMLYRAFGIDAELLIDHAKGIETTLMSDIKNYHTRSNSISSGQVLANDYSYEDGCLIVKEMTELLCLDLVERGIVTKNISLYIGYSKTTPAPSSNKAMSLFSHTSSSRVILEAMEKLYWVTAVPGLMIKRINISFNECISEENIQYDLFTDPEESEKERNLMRAMNSMKKKYGKNAILKGMNLEKGGTTIERNRQIGGHRSGS